jgi:hypothetical protein
MIIPMKNFRPVIDFFPFMYLVEEKYNFKFRDMAGKSLWEKETRDRVCFEHGYDYNVWGKIAPADMTAEELEFKKIFYAELDKSPPYLDTWHFMLDHDFYDLNRGSCRTMKLEESVIYSYPGYVQTVYRAIKECVQDNPAYNKTNEHVNFWIDW